MTAPRISAAMIVRDAAESIRAAIESLRGVVDEVVVLDTGSVDATPLIAAEVGAAWNGDPPLRVEHWAWRDDFSAARNEAAARCSGDWIVVLDSDEVLEPGNFRQTILACPDDVDGVAALVVCRVASGERDRFMVPRAYRKTRGRWIYPAHNQLAGLRRVARSTAVVHSDYTNAGGVPARLGRTVPILERHYAENPRLIHAPVFLARMYAAVKDWRAAGLWAEVALRVGEGQPGDVGAWIVLTQVAYEQGGADAASRVLAQAAQAVPQAPDIWHVGLAIMAAKWIEVAGDARGTPWEVASSRYVLDRERMQRAQAALDALALGVGFRPEAWQDLPDYRWSDGDAPEGATTPTGTAEADAKSPKS